MGIDLKKYERMKEAADEAQREADLSAARLEALMERMKDEFGISTIKKAKAELAKLQEQQKEAENEYNRRYAEFVEKYPELEDPD